MFVIDQNQHSRGTDIDYINRDGYFKIFPEAKERFTFVNGLMGKSKPVSTTKFKILHLEKTENVFTPSAAITAAQTTLTFTGSAWKSIVPNAVLEIQNISADGTTAVTEYVQVTGVSGTSVTVNRGFNGTTASAFTANSRIYRQTNVFGDGSHRPSYVYQEPTSMENYCQIFRNDKNMTETESANEEYILKSSADKIKERNRELGEEHLMDIEGAMLYGKASNSLTDIHDSSGVNKVGATTGGLNSFVESGNIIDALAGIDLASAAVTSTLMTKALFKSILEQAVAISTDTKTREVLCGFQFYTGVLRIIEEASNVRFNYEGSAVGMATAGIAGVTMYQYAGYTFKFILSEYMKEDAAKVVGGKMDQHSRNRRSTSAFIYEPMHIGMRHMVSKGKSRLMMPMKNELENGVDAEQWGKLTHAGLYIKSKKSLFKVENAH